MFILAWFASIVWLLHGYYTQDIPVIVSSAMTLISETMMIYMIYQFKN
jgi:uncharacterized protein with PQ loop repeat